MSAMLKFDFQKREQLRFSEVNNLNYTKKTQFCMWQLAYIFPKTSGNKNKPWTHSTLILIPTIALTLSRTSTLPIFKSA